jgi:very-short-patch-repair endonuclease
MMARQSNLETAFETYWRVYWRHRGNPIIPPSLLPEYRFHAKRKWAFDFAHIQAKVAVEIEGGTFTNGRHTRGAGYAADCEKYNQATAMGWAILRYTSDMLSNDPMAVCEQIATLIESRLP